MHVYGTMSVNDAIAEIVEFWAKEIFDKQDGGFVRLTIDNDGQITVREPKEGA
jgi:mannose/cellobiose epimerase-like protein (N-acyl-D-glucosamine 2-epimerase family)